MDTGVIVAAIRSRTGASRRLLRLALQKRFDTLLSVPLMLEYEEVLKRREHLLAARASAAQIEAIIDALAAVATPVETNFSWRPVLSDPDDEMVLEAAVNGGADLIVTFNVRHLRMVAHRFGVRTVTPSAALALIESSI